MNEANNSPRSSWAGEEWISAKVSSAYFALCTPFLTGGCESKVIPCWRLLFMLSSVTRSARTVLPIQHVPHLLRQGTRSERLLEEGDFRLQYPVPHDRIIGVAAQVQYLDARLRLGQPLGQPPTAHA